MTIDTSLSVYTNTSLSGSGVSGVGAVGGGTSGASQQTGDVVSISAEGKVLAGSMIASNANAAAVLENGAARDASGEADAQEQAAESQSDGQGEDDGSMQAAGTVMDSKKNASSSNENTKTSEKIKKQIEKVQKEIQELESQEIPEEEKRTKTSALQSELVQLQAQYLKALKAEKQYSPSDSGSGGNTSTTAYGAAG